MTKTTDHIDIKDDTERLYQSIVRKRLLLSLLTLLSFYILSTSHKVNAQAAESSSKCVTTLPGFDNINIRTGEGTDYPRFSVLDKLDVLSLVSPEEKEGWRQVQLQDGRLGYVTDQYTQIGDCDELSLEKTQGYTNAVYYPHRKYTGESGREYVFFGENRTLTDQQIVDMAEITRVHVEGVYKEHNYDSYPVAILFGTEAEAIKLNPSIPQGRYNGVTTLARFNGSVLTPFHSGTGDIVTLTVVYSDKGLIFTEGMEIAHEVFGHANGMGHSGFMNAYDIGMVYGFASTLDRFSNNCNSIDVDGDMISDPEYRDYCNDLGNALYPHLEQ